MLARLAAGWRQRRLNKPRSAYQRAQRSAIIAVLWALLYTTWCVWWSIYDINHGDWGIAIFLCAFALLTIAFLLLRNIRVFLNMRARGY